jgi:hypothetical protein
MTLNVEALLSNKTSLTIHQSTGNLQHHHHENLKSHKIILDECISNYREKPYTICNQFIKGCVNGTMHLA